MFRFCVAAFLSAMLVFPANSQVAGCDALLKGGVFDTRLDTNSVDFEKSFRYFFCSKATKSSSGNNKGDLKVGIPDIIDFGGSGASSSTQNELNEMCTSTFDWSRLKQETRTYISTASKILVDGFNKCMNSQGLHSTVILSGDPKIFNVGINYVSSGVAGDKTALTFKRIQTANAECVISTKTKITNAVSYFQCSRKDANNGSQIILYFDDGLTSIPMIVPAAFRAWTPTKIGPGFIPTSEGWKIYIDQNGRSVTWQLDSPVFIHNLTGKFIEADEWVGIQTRTNKTNGCAVKQIYNFKVPAPYRIQGTASLLPLSEQPTKTFCDLDANWQNVLNLTITPTP